MTQDWDMHQWLWGAWGVGMMLMMVVFWGVVVAGIVVAIRWLAGQTREPRSDRASRSGPGLQVDGR